uniref:Putative widespread mucin n=1 Tax=Anopheles triannulatus TaxID=58253 RepID=A0A2M4B0V4_9DIPT
MKPAVFGGDTRCLPLSPLLWMLQLLFSHDVVPLGATSSATRGRTRAPSTISPPPPLPSPIILLLAPTATSAPRTALLPPPPRANTSGISGALLAPPTTAAAVTALPFVLLPSMSFRGPELITLCWLLLPAEKGSSTSTL